MLSPSRLCGRRGGLCLQSCFQTEKSAANQGIFQGQISELFSAGSLWKYPSPIAHQARYIVFVPVRCIPPGEKKKPDTGTKGYFDPLAPMSGYLVTRLAVMAAVPLLGTSVLDLEVDGHLGYI